MDEKKTGGRIMADDGFYFGLGVFETIFVSHRRLILEEYHRERLLSGLEKLGIALPCGDWNHLKESMQSAMDAFEQTAPKEAGGYVLKVCVSSQNIQITTRRNTYTPADYQKGFSLRISPILRNETSPFTGIKSMNYGDNILEKRRAHREGFDEPVFLNRRGLLTEGATTNLFAVLDGRLVTPSSSCGLLPGTMRRYILEHYPANEVELTPEMLLSASEIFVTNALLGVMPVTDFEGTVWKPGPMGKEIGLFYQKNQL